MPEERIVRFAVLNGARSIWKDRMKQNPLDFVKFNIIDEKVGKAILITYPKGIAKFKEAVSKW